MSPLDMTKAAQKLETTLSDVANHMAKEAVQPAAQPSLRVVREIKLDPSRDAPADRFWQNHHAGPLSA